MKKVLNFIRKHKLLVLLIILLIILLVFCVKVFLIFNDKDEVAIYGERLKGVEKVTIDADKYTKNLTKKLAEQAKSVTVRRQGRILNVIIDVKDEVNRDGARALANQSVEEFTDKEKEYYDIQIFLKKTGNTEDKAQFPLIGYRHHTQDGINWTKDR